MLLTAFKWLAIQFVVISLLLLSIWAALSTIYGGTYGQKFLEITITGMIAPWVWTFGYGLMTFIMTSGKSVANELNQIFEPGEEIAKATIRIEKSTLHRSALLLTLPVTILGALLTFMYRVPHYGASYYLITTAVISIYYVASYILFHFLGVLSAFHGLYENMPSVRLNRYLSPLHLDNLMNYFSLTTVIGALAIYCGFRGTLTAGFEFRHEVWRVFLTTPLILFLPVTLFYNFYPRYVLRKIIQYRLLVYMNKLTESNIDDAKSLLLDIRTVAMVNSQMLPFVDYKSLPSYIVAIVFVITLLLNNDPVVKSFFKLVLGLGGNSQ